MRILAIAVIITSITLPSCTRGQNPGNSRPADTSLTAPVGTAPARNTGPGVQRMTVLLRDGSRLSAVPLVRSLPLKTAYSTIEADLAKVRSITFSRDGKSATVDFRNGDFLHGTFLTESFPVETVLGKIDVPVSTIQEISGLSAGADLTAGLSAYYPLDGNCADASGHGSDGVNHGAAPGIDRFGRDGGAMEFNGNGAYVGLPNGLIDPAGTGFTLSLWALPRETSAYRILFYDGTNTAETGVSVKEGIMNFAARLEDDRGFAAEAPVTAGNYIHVACVYRRGVSLELWLNGALAATTPIPDGVLMHGSHVHSGAIGSYAPEQTNHMRAYSIRTWLGLVDDVRLYARALKQPEIELLSSDH